MTDGGWASPAGPEPERPQPAEPAVPAGVPVAPPPYGQQVYPSQHPSQDPQQPFPAPPYPPPPFPPAYPPYGYQQPPPPPRPAPRPVGVDAYRPREYPQLLRGPGHRGWKPVVSIFAGTAVAFGVILASSLVAFLALLASTGSSQAAQRRLESEEFYAEPGGFLLNNVMLAALIPLAMAAVWLVHGWRPRWLASVRPGIRWRWLLECSGYATAYILVLVGVGLLAGDSYTWDPEPHLWAFVAIVLLTQPLQAAGEEYAFRGLLGQAIGSWFSRPLVSALVAGAVTSTLFALAHGTQSPWLFADRFWFGATAAFLVWRTGGLEAGIALHAVNNLWAIGASVVTGTVAESITATDYPPLAAVLDIVAMSAFAAFVSWRAKRRGLQRVHDPAKQPGGAVPSGPYGVPVPAGPWGAHQALAQQHLPPAGLPQPGPPQPGPPQPGPQPPPSAPWGGGG